MKRSCGFERYVGHLDMNCFYAAVEMLLHPELRFVPLAICGSTEERHGIVLTANYIAKRQYGIKTGMVNHEARALCKDLVQRPPNRKQILRFAAKARRIGLRYTDRIQGFGPDEFWFDLSGIARNFEEAIEIVNMIRLDFINELGLTISIGLANDKITAKLASDMVKPDGITLIPRELRSDIVYPLPVSDLLYVGPSRTKTFAQEGIHTIGQLAESPLWLPVQALGKVGEMLWSFANGYDVSPVAEEDDGEPGKTIGNSITAYRDLVNEYDAWRFAIMLSESVAMRCMGQGVKARGMGISVRNSDLKGYTKQMMFKTPTNRAMDFARGAMELLKGHFWSMPIRSLGVRARELVDDSFHRQLDVYTDEAAVQKLEDLDRAVFEIREKYHDQNIIQRGVLLTEDRLKRLKPKDEHLFTPPGQFAV